MEEVALIADEVAQEVRFYTPFTMDLNGFYAGIAFSAIGVFLITWILIGLKNKLFGNPRARLERNPNGSRFSQEACCICLEASIALPVVSPCGHTFCGSCIVRCWLSINKKQLNCPICRRLINLLYIDFNEDEAQTEPQKRMLKFLREYNTVYSGQSRTVTEMIQDSPFLLRVLAARIWSWRNLGFVLTAMIQSQRFFLSVLYIIAPIDLISEAEFGAVGYIDDFLVLLVVIILVANISYALIQSIQQRQN